jgi:hypothetical protein
MAVKLIDLQLIYGVAGAREKFEDLVTQLIKGEHPGADKVRVVQGDGGIDVHIGDPTDPDGIEVYQCKFFPLGLDESQKAQIRRSFQACLGSTKFKTKKWTLCLPLDLSFDEKKWFKDWKAKQAGSGIVVEDPWGATKLEGLLYLEKNRGLREAFFKEEHLTQIRELHALLQRLLPDITERLRQDAAERDQARRSDALGRQADDIARFLAALREDYLALVIQAAGAAGTPGKQPAHWEVVIRPSWIPAHEQIESLKDCWTIIEYSRVQSNDSEYPVLRSGSRQAGGDWVGATRLNERDIESWRLSQRGLFAHMFPVWDDVQAMGQEGIRWPWDLPRGFVPQHFLDIDVTIRTITHVHRFAANLADKAFDPGDAKVEVSIRLTGTCDRVLITWDDVRRLKGCYRATEPVLEHTWSYPREDLRSTPERFAIKAVNWFFERFGWQDVSPEILSRIQSRIFSGH